MRNKSFDEEEIGGEYALIRYREGRGSQSTAIIGVQVKFCFVN